MISHTSRSQFGFNIYYLITKVLIFNLGFDMRILNIRTTEFRIFNILKLVKLFCKFPVTLEIVETNKTFYIRFIISKNRLDYLQGTRVKMLFKMYGKD